MKVEELRLTCACCGEPVQDSHANGVVDSRRVGDSGLAVERAMPADDVELQDNVRCCRSCDAPLSQGKGGKWACNDPSCGFYGIVQGGNRW